MFNDECVNFNEFVGGIGALGFMPYFRFRKSKTGDHKEHDHIAVICRDEPCSGAHIARVCVCCIGKVHVNDYEGFKEAISLETYDQLVNLITNFSYTDVDYKAIR